MQALHLRGRAVAVAVTNEEMLLCLFVGVIAAGHERRIAVHLLTEARELAVAGPEDGPAHARQLVVVATRYGFRLQAAEDSTLGDFQSEAAEDFLEGLPVDTRGGERACCHLAHI